MYAKYDWEQLTSIHGILGLLGMIITFLVGVSGVVTIWVMFRAADERWEKHERITAIARIHRITGYVMLVFGNIIVSGGITTYLVSLGFGGKSAIGFFCITTWILCLVIMAMVTELMTPQPKETRLVPVTDAGMSLTKFRNLK
jgi:uncharacterized membrane protein